jgi:hypothetical protein
VTGLRVRRTRASQCLWEITVNASVRGRANCRAQAISASSGASSRALSTGSTRSLLTLDLSSAAWCAKINFVEGGDVVGTRLRAGRAAWSSSALPQSAVNHLSSFTNGVSHRSRLAGKCRSVGRFYPFCSQKRFLLDFLEISAVACSEAFIEVPVRPRCQEHMASRERCARGEAKDRESGCGQ